MEDDQPRTIKTAERLFDIIEALDELEEASVSELASYADIPKSTLYQYLSTFEKRGYVVKRNNTYRLGLRLLGQGTKIRNRMSLYQYGRPYIRDLADTTGENVWLTVEEHGHGVTLDHAVGEHGFDKFSGLIGGLSELHTHATGKAILAHLPQDQIESIINSTGLPAYTDNTINNKKELFNELMIIRDQGHAFNDGEAIEGVRTVGVAITSDEDVFGAIAVGGPQNRLQGEYYKQELPELLHGIANEIQLQISVASPW